MWFADRSRLVYLIVLGLAVVAVYGQSVLFDFVTYDDYELVYKNEEFLSRVSNVFTSFTTHVFTSHRPESAYYRPILLTSYILDYQIWGLNPFGYHLFNVLLHLVVSVLVFRVFELLSSDRRMALIGSLFFALHPIQTESVGWVAGRNDVLLGLFIVLMLLLYRRVDEEGERRKIVALVPLCFLVALFTKESAAFYALLLPAYDLTVRRMSVKESFTSNRLKLYGLLALVFGLYLATRFMAIGSIIGADRLSGTSSLFERLLNVPSMFVELLSMMLVPIHQSIVHPPDEVMWLSQPWVTVAVLLLVGWIFVVRWAWRKDALLGFALLWVMIGLLPALNVLPLAVTILEHRLYLPMVGCALAVSRGMVLFADWLGRPALAPAVGTVVVGLAAIGSFNRLPVWKNSETLWTDAIQKAPSSSRSYFNLAGYHFERLEYEKTIDLMERYVALKPDDFIGYSKLRQTYFLSGRYEDALRVCKQMIERNPRNPNRYTETADLYIQLHMPDSAIAICRQGLSVDSTFLQLHYYIGSVCVRLNKFLDAERSFRQVLELNPRHAGSHFGIGRIRAARGDTASAVEAIETGIQYETPPPDLLTFLRSFYAASGQVWKERELVYRFNAQPQ